MPNLHGAKYRWESDRELHQHPNNPSRCSHVVAPIKVLPFALADSGERVDLLHSSHVSHMCKGLLFRDARTLQLNCVFALHQHSSRLNAEHISVRAGPRSPIKASPLLYGQKFSTCF